MSTHEDIEALAALDAVGAASVSEQASLQAHLDSCAECRMAHDEYSEAATAFARDLEPVNPPYEVRGAIMDTLEIDDGDDTLREIVEYRRRNDPRWWLATAATVFFALWGWRELALRAAHEHIQSRDAEIRTLSEQNTLLTQRNQRLTSEIAGLAASDTRVISLIGQQVAPSASARVFIEPANRRAVVFFSNLPTNANDKSYQLWIIRSDQSAPQSAGVFDATSNGSATVTVENLPVDTTIKAMAVTVEPRGGVPQPTNANYVLMGKS
jgi:anti-sigma-K factor RskA